MFYKLTYSIQDLFLSHPKHERFDFRYDGPHNVNVAIRATSKEKDNRADKTALTEAVCRQDPQPHILRMFESLSRIKCLRDVI